MPALAALAHEVRLAWCGPEVEVEGILSAKTGRVPRGLPLLLAVGHHFDAPILATPFLDAEEILAAAKETAAIGASEFCIVLAVRGPNPIVMDQLVRITPMVQEQTGLNVAVSAGILTRRQAERLAEAGVHRYNHNLETARSYFPEIVTTHTWEERFDTCRLVREVGMELCCGVLLGMGETDAQRLELLAELRQVAAGRGADQLPQPPARARRWPTARWWSRWRPSGGSPCSGWRCPT